MMQTKSLKAKQRRASAHRKFQEWARIEDARRDVMRHREELSAEDWPYPDNFWQSFLPNVR